MAKTTVAERAQRTAIRKNTCILSKHLHQLTTQELQMLTAPPKQRNTQRIQFFMWLFCKRLQRLLSNWWRGFLICRCLFSICMCFLKLQRVEHVQNVLIIFFCVTIAFCSMFSFYHKLANNKCICDSLHLIQFIKPLRLFHKFDYSFRDSTFTTELCFWNVTLSVVLQKLTCTR